ncbi:hypothetical protein [Actinomycetospora aeridis]|uniref:Excreted virulence factor EspC (Type VII ESX diderm) n=1 Tax=Actinomycetospora aeridis TaxID=3129231 RepID=A0ABU8N902_9PSEU
MADVRVVLQSLLDAAHGVDAVMDELAAHDAGELRAGPSAFGHDALAVVVGDFGERWSHGLANLTDDGNALARGLAEAAHAYADAEGLVVEQFRFGR